MDVRTLTQIKITSDAWSVEPYRFRFHIIFEVLGSDGDSNLALPACETYLANTLLRLAFLNSSLGLRITKTNILNILLLVCGEFINLVGF